jgi:hypothetical protein
VEGRASLRLGLALAPPPARVEDILDPGYLLGVKLATGCLKVRLGRDVRCVPRRDLGARQLVPKGLVLVPGESLDLAPEAARHVLLGLPWCIGQAPS